ncbi:MAG: hypothetical protein LBS90_05995 [Oscillospiraceae bacterium]|jgi:hypothetical protein|nr:hypothetical protein [Oscillospiraceae bacterium]
MTNVELLTSRFAALPRIGETGPQSGFNGKRMTALGRRTRLIHAALCVIGLAPFALWLLYLLKLVSFKVPPQLVAVGFGLVVPGGGFIACGEPVTVAIGLFICFWLWKKRGMMIQDFLGSFMGIVGFWALGAAGGLLAFGWYSWDYAAFGLAPFGYAPWGYAAAVGTAFALFVPYELQVRRMYKQMSAARDERLPLFDDAVAELDAATGDRSIVGEKEFRQNGGGVRSGDTAKEPGADELDDEQLLAARYLLEATVREKGDFDGFEHLFGLADYRYQLSVYGYGLMLLHAKYLPNFEGYLKKAHRFLIESYSDPRTCGYWAKQAKVGYLSNNPDPIVKANVMLSGWMMPVVAGYRDQYGDDEYEKEASIRFQPFADKPEETYDYNSAGVFGVLYRQYKNHEYPYMLIPCEPHVAFPACNSVALLGMLVYDRDHGTDYCAGFWDELYDNLQSDFIEIDGTMALRRQYQYGLRHLPSSQIGYMPLADVQNYMHFSAIFPGLARRCYALVRKTLLSIDADGAAQVNGQPWDMMFNMFTMKPDPSTQIAMLELTAAEYGDLPVYDALRVAESRFLAKSKDPTSFKFKDVNSLTVAYIALARLIKKGYWSDVILRGMPETSKTGPVLTDCPFPDVIPAKASSSGDDLDLVLTTSGEPVAAGIRIERLKPGARYAYGAGAFTADADGAATLTVEVGRRTAIHIVPEA